MLTHYSSYITLSDVRLATETFETRRSRPVHLELAEHQGRFSESRREQAADETRELEEQVPGAHTLCTGLWDLLLTVLLPQPYQGKCKDCKSNVTQNRAKYCHGAFITNPSHGCRSWK